jgi:hypothetical protein
MTGTYDRRLGPHHFAYLRSVAEGLPREDAARRYLGMIHGHELVTLHRQLVDHLRALARRAGDSRWRLIGLELGTRSATPRKPSSPSLHDWAEAEGLGDWSHAELLEMYQQRFPRKTRMPPAGPGEAHGCVSDSSMCSPHWNRWPASRRNPVTGSMPGLTPSPQIGCTRAAASCCRTWYSESRAARTGGAGFVPWAPPRRCGSRPTFGPCSRCCGRP